MSRGQTRVGGSRTRPAGHPKVSDRSSKAGPAWEPRVRQEAGVSRERGSVARVRSEAGPLPRQTRTRGPTSPARGRRPIPSAPARVSPSICAGPTVRLSGTVPAAAFQARGQVGTSIGLPPGKCHQATRPGTLEVAVTAVESEPDRRSEPSPGGSGRRALERSASALSSSLVDRRRHQAQISG